MQNKRGDPFAREYATCNYGDNKWKYDNLPNFPILLDLEIVGGYCTMACPMCALSREEIKRERGFMSEETHDLIIEQAAEYKTPIRYIGYGESLMHPSFWKFAQKAKDIGIKTHLDTNGTKLREIKAELSSIKISVHENYPRVIKGLESLATANCYKYASITEDELEETGFDLSQFPFDALDKVKVYKQFKQGFKGERPSSCPEVFSKLKINFDGSVSACCSDYDNLMLVGSIYKETIKEIWHGPRMQHYRKLIIEGKNWGLPLCRDCFELGATSD